MSTHSTFKWSPRQQAAIDAMNTNVLVSASAGAGKTTVLIGRLVKRLEIDRISLDEVIAITFTELAATEMRKRLAKQLTERFDETQDAHLYRQLSLLPSAHISTIHAFCLTLIENYAYVIDLDPKRASKVMDDAQKAELLNDAFEKAFKQLIQEEPIGMRDLSMHFDRKPENTTQLKEASFALLSKMNTLKDPYAWASQSLKHLEAQSMDDLDPSLKHYVSLYYRWKIDDFILKAENAFNTADTDVEYQSKLETEGQVEQNQEKYRKAMLLNQAKLSRFKEVFIPIRNDFSYGAFQKALETFRTAVSSQSIPVPKRSKAVEKSWAAYDKAYEKLLNENFEEKAWFEDFNELKHRMAVLVRLSFAIRDIYTQTKVAQNVMDFDDMEHLAIAILKDEKFKIADQFKAKIKEIMVDEFQDTNELQNELVELLSNGKNIFRVGDVKQSIYRFRNAQPQLMQALMHTEDEYHKVLYLNENYRSKQNIVHFNNVLFDQLMNFSEFDSQYTDDDSVQIGTDRQKGGDPVSLHYLKSSEDYMQEEDVEEENGLELDSVEDDDLDAPKIKLTMEKDENAQPKVMHIINTIISMMNDPQSKHHEFKDFVVLVRSNSEKTLLKQQFEKANIPHHISTKTGFYNASSVQDVLMMLNFMVNPSDDLNLVGLLLSDFVGLTEDELADLAIHKNKRAYISVLKERFPERHQVLMDFRTSLLQKTLVEILRETYAFNHYYDENCTKQQRVNLDYLFEKAITYAQASISLSEFVLRLKNIEDTESSEAIPFTEEDNVVRVMTIHQAKGLEFKVVFYFTRLLGGVKDNQSALLADSDLGFMLKTIRLPQYLTRTNPLRIALEMKNTLEDVQEQIRLMYVAMTRAEDKLIIVDSAPGYQTPLTYATVLNAIGSTRLLYSVIDVLKQKTEAKIETKENPSDFARLERILPRPKAFTIAPKKTMSVEFTTPSSTHPQSHSIHLNFNPQAGTNHGTQMHKLFEDLPLVEWTETLIRSYKEDITSTDMEAVLAFYHHRVYQAMRQGQLKHEYAFHALMENQVVHGYMDLISITEDKVYLVDYKTDQLTDPLQFIEAYQDQLLLYQEVLALQYPSKTVETYLYSLALKEFIKV